MSTGRYLVCLVSVNVFRQIMFHLIVATIIVYQDNKIKFHPGPFLDMYYSDHSASCSRYYFDSWVIRIGLVLCRDEYSLRITSIIK